MTRRQQAHDESQAAKLVASAHASALRKGLTGVALIAEVDTLLSLTFHHDMGNIHAAEAMAMWHRQCEEWAQRAPR